MILSRLGLALCAALILSSCGLPRPGPNRSEIAAGSVENGGNAYIVPVDETVIRAANESPVTGFPSAFLTGGALNTDVIRRGDVLGITVLESVDTPLLGTAGAGAANRVDRDGMIFVPFVGRITAAGKTVEALRQELTEAYAQQTPDPQVQISRQEGEGATVTILGEGSSGVFPITNSTLRLSEMLAAAGTLVSTNQAASTKIFVKRGGRSGEIFFTELYDDDRNDIFLRDGDRIEIKQDERRFTLLGAGGQGLVNFPSADFSVLEAISFAGGLNSGSSDPRGIFVFRDEAEGFARKVTGVSDLAGPQRLVYVVDITQPNGIFIAREFLLKDGDTMVITEAPFTQWTKAINAILSTSSTLQNITTIGQTQ